MIASFWAALLVWASMASAHDPAVSTVELRQTEAGWVMQVSVATDGAHMVLMEREPDFLSFDNARWKKALVAHARESIVVSSAGVPVPTGPIAVRAGVHQTDLVLALPAMEGSFDLSVRILDLPQQTQVVRVRALDGEVRRHVLGPESTYTVTWPSDFIDSPQAPPIQVASH